MKTHLEIGELPSTQKERYFTNLPQNIPKNETKKMNNLAPDKNLLRICRKTQLERRKKNLAFWGLNL